VVDEILLASGEEVRVLEREIEGLREEELDRLGTQRPARVLVVLLSAWQRWCETMRDGPSHA
jgi:hypothetical protein